MKLRKIIPFVLMCFMMITALVYAQNYPDEKIPITPYDIIKRVKDVPKILEWSRNKHLTISGPYFFGTHHFYIDNNLKHVLILLKDDLTSHVLIGNPTRAEEWRKYDKDINLLFSKKSGKDLLEWKIYQDIVLYKGLILPQKEIQKEPYWGRIISVEECKDVLSDHWIIKKIKELYNKK